MANLRVTIVIRTTSPEGKRGWVKATGKNDPAGPLYLRAFSLHVYTEHCIYSSL